MVLIVAAVLPNTQILYTEKARRRFAFIEFVFELAANRNLVVLQGIVLLEKFENIQQKKEFSCFDSI